jgi:hypothetical protein
MEKFFIDSCVGIDTWIDVENGVVTKIDSILNPKMSDEYVGKTISFLKSDFEKRMKPSWRCVKCLRWCEVFSPLVNIESQRKMAYNYHSSRVWDGMSEEKSNELLHIQLSEINRKENALKAEFDSLKHDLENIHNFKVNYNI